MEVIKKILFLEPHSSKAAKNLSGGNKRKLCLAMALIKTPKLIFMDEASNGVDPVSRKNVYAYLRSLKDISALIITHRIDEAEKICDKIAIMADGRFLDLDLPQKLKEKHGTVYMLQVEPAISTPINLANLNKRITTSLPFCKRLEAVESSTDDEDGYVLMRPKLTYRFDDVDPLEGHATREAEVRRRILHMLKYVTLMLQEGTILDYAIYRSSLEQVFKRLIMRGIE